MAALEARLTSAEAARDEAQRGCAERDAKITQLDEAVVTLRDGPGAGLMKAWDTERQELIQDVEAAEDRILTLQQKVRRGAVPVRGTVVASVCLSVWLGHTAACRVVAHAAGEVTSNSACCPP